MRETSRAGRAITASPTLAPGSRIRHYELVRELGRGGMGVVYEARDVKLGRRVAIKLLHSTTRDVADRFLIEARATARCTHENIVVIHEVDEHDRLPYMVLELIEGRSLRDLMKQPVDPSRVVELLLGIGRALHRAHGLGIVHRDLKPENVLVTEAGQAKVLDFGIAKALGDNDVFPAELKGAQPESLQLTAEGAIVGTLPYMAPEQMVADIDHRTDLWALGIIGFELLAGHHPIQPLANDALIANLLNDVPMPSARSIAGVPGPLAAIIDACLAKPKAARIASAAEVVSKLEDLRTERRSGAVPPVHAIAAPPPPRRRRWWIPSLAGVTVVAVVAAAFVVSRDPDIDVVAPQALPDPPPKPKPLEPRDSQPAVVVTPPPALVDPPPKPVTKRTKPRTPPKAGSGSAAPKPCSIYTDRVGC